MKENIHKMAIHINTNSVAEKEFEDLAYISKDPVILNTEFLDQRLMIFSPQQITSPIMWAVRKNHLEIVKYLVESGISPEFAIRTAVNCERIEIVKFLIKKGIRGKTLCDIAVKFVVKNNIEMINWLLDKDNYLDRLLQNKRMVTMAINYQCVDALEAVLSKNIFSEEFIHNIGCERNSNDRGTCLYFRTPPDPEKTNQIRSLLTNYKHLSYTKACK